jgi:hypothetical protein
MLTGKRMIGKAKVRDGREAADWGAMKLFGIVDLRESHEDA